MHNLENDSLTIKIKNIGAELCSIVNHKNSKEYIWQADPQFWKRHSPILFPIVGALWNETLRHNDNTYTMSQHGFARDENFEVIRKTQSSIFFQLSSNEKTKKIYPFDFDLTIGYTLSENKVIVSWEVLNKGSETMYFQIGAHPAFYYPDSPSQNDIKGYFSFNKKENLEHILIAQKGCANSELKYSTPLNNGFLEINKQTFENDALIFEDSQINKVALLDIHKKPYLTLHFESPVVGLWEPNKESPFVCIEPWYGRCDEQLYTGLFKDKKWINQLQINERFDASYTIEIE